MKRDMLVLVLSCSFFGYTFSAEVPEQRIGLRQFKGIVRYAAEYLKENHEILLFEMNESGFVRVKIPVSPVEKAQGISKIRLNYWRPGSKMDGNNHSHPSYFESLVVNGGYTHKLYQLEGDERFRHYRINSLREASDEGEVLLKNIGEISTNVGDIVIYDKSLIHRIIDSQPETLSINAVFKTNDDDGYDVYTDYESGKTIEDVSQHRAVLGGAIRASLAESIVDSLLTFE